MTTGNGEGGTGLDSGAALYSGVPLDYLDTVRDLVTWPIPAPQPSRERPPVAEAGAGEGATDAALLEAFGGAYALIVEVGEARQLRRRLVMSLAAAERARRRAEDRGQSCRVALVRLELVAELDRAPREGGVEPCHG